MKLFVPTLLLPNRISVARKQKNKPQIPNNKERTMHELRTVADEKLQTFYEYVQKIQKCTRFEHGAWEISLVADYIQHNNSVIGSEHATKGHTPHCYEVPDDTPHFLNYSSLMRGK